VFDFAWKLIKHQWQWRGRMSRYSCTCLGSSKLARQTYLKFWCLKFWQMFPPKKDSISSMFLPKLKSIIKLNSFSGSLKSKGFLSSLLCCHSCPNLPIQTFISSHSASWGELYVDTVNWSFSHSSVDGCCWWKFHESSIWLNQLILVNNFNIDKTWAILWNIFQWTLSINR